MNLETHTSPIEKRQKLTRFICQELLYEFVSGRLDRERQKAVDSYLETCRDSQRELEHLHRAITYANVAARLQVAPELHEALSSFEPQWKKSVSTWTEKFSRRGWRVLPYAFVFAALILVAVAIKPWRHVSHNEVTLVEQLKLEPDIVSPPANVKIDSPAIATLAEPATPPIAPQAQDTEESSDEETASPAPTPTKQPTYDGFLTRGDIEVEDFDNAWPAIRNKIEALGGKAAGNVELGWIRRKGESYFHFSLPESNRQEMELFLKTFGPVRFSTEGHPRVMPEGQIRIILTVKDGGHGSGEETETP